MELNDELSSEMIDLIGFLNISGNKKSFPVMPENFSFVFIFLSGQ